MNNCLYCDKETKNAKYCSSSCSAKVNNVGVRRHGAAPSDCLTCGVHLTSSQKQFCGSKCHKEHMHKVKIDKWKETGEVGTRTAKRHLIETKNECWSCGITDWNGSPIVFDLEHIDGNSENNAEVNLSLLCPNCHSQTDTYKGKNRGSGRHARRERYASGKSF